MIPVEVVAQAIREHGWNENSMECACGDKLEKDWDYQQDRDHAPHVATAVIAALGLLEDGVETVRTNNLPPIRTGYTPPLEKVTLRRFVTHWTTS